MPSAKSQSADTAPVLQDASEPFVGRWNRLVSTTNWEKGRIIGQWRKELIEAGAAAADYSDEAWARLVGGVTGQHVGRLRRVFARFGEVYEQYEGLYWSHFQSALDWDDAEMWLEGAVQNRWSVSQMRSRRWETLGAVAAEQPRDADIVASELDEDFEPAQGDRPESLLATRESVRDAPRRDAPDFADEDEEDAKPRIRDRDSSTSKKNGEQSGASVYSEDDPHLTIVRPFQNLAELPDDLAEAFESFKLAILRHKTGGWEEISRDDVLASLDALKELALAPSAEAAPF